MYYVVPLTKVQVAQGALMQIQDYLIKKSDDSMRLIAGGGRATSVEEIVVNYTNSYDNPEFYEQWSHDIFNVAYLNEVSYRLLESGGVVSSSKTVDELPKKTVGGLRVPLYV